MACCFGTVVLNTIKYTIVDTVDRNKSWHNLSRPDRPGALSTAELFTDWDAAADQQWPAVNLLLRPDKARCLIPALLCSSTRLSAGVSRPHRARAHSAAQWHDRSDATTHRARSHKATQIGSHKPPSHTRRQDTSGEYLENIA